MRVWGVIQRRKKLEETKRFQMSGGISNRGHASGSLYRPGWEQHLQAQDREGGRDAQVPQQKEAIEVFVSSPSPGP